VRSTRVVVLGATGRLGSMVAAVLGDDPSLEVVATDRARFDVERDEVGPLLDGARADWVVNAVGVTAAHIDAALPARAELAGPVRRPRRGGAGAAGVGVIDVPTDGLFGGAVGGPTEAAPLGPEPLGVYAATKLEGEVETTLRCSLVGPEGPGGTSLLAWVLSQ